MAKIDQSFPADAFQFIHLPIRQADVDNRNFLERFFIGIQSQFEDTQKKINTLIELIDAKKTPDYAVKYLKDHVGFTRELDYITQGLTTDELRKLIILAVPLWRQKGLEVGYKNIVRLFTGAGSRVFNWFDFRLIVGEKALGEEQLGEDSWLISVPGVEGSNPTGSIIALFTFEDNFKDRSLTKNDALPIGSSMYDYRFYDVGAVDGSEHRLNLTGGRLRVPHNSKYNFENNLTIEGFFKTNLAQSATLFRTESDDLQRLIEISLNTNTNELSFTAKTEDIIIIDQSVYNNDGELEGSLVPTLGGDPTITDSTRRLQGNGVDQSITFLHGSQYNLVNAWTIEFSIKRVAAPGSTQRILGKQISLANLNGSYRIDAEPTGLKIAIRDFITGLDDTYTIPFATVFDNTWHNVAFVKSGTQLFTYLDGTRINILNLVNSSALDANAPLILLKRVDNTLWDNSQIDELRISNTSRYTGATYIPAIVEFVDDANTSLLAHFDETNIVTATITSAFNLSDNDWRHFALVFNKNTAKARMYLDGVESTAELNIGLRDMSTLTSWFIAADNTAGLNNYQGDLDNVRVALSAIYDVTLATLVVPSTTFIEYKEEQLDEFQTDIRVVDNGNLNKDLILKVLNLMRPVSERLNVIYIRYFEDFEIGKGTLQTISGSSQVVDGALVMNPGSAEHCDLLNDTEFKDIFLIASVILPMSGSFAIRFNIQNANDYYRAVVNIATSTMRLERVVAGVPTLLDGPTYVDIVPGSQYVMSISTFYDNVLNQTMIRYLHDSNLVGQVFDSAYEKGKFGFEALGAQVTIKEIEMFLKPLKTNRINPNFVVQ